MNTKATTHRPRLGIDSRPVACLVTTRIVEEATPIHFDPESRESIGSQIDRAVMTAVENGDTLGELCIRFEREDWHRLAFAIHKARMGGMEA